MNITVSLRELEKNVHGRCAYEEEALVLSWSASGFSFRCNTERAAIHFVPDHQADQPCYIGVRTDNGAFRKYAVSTGAEKILIEGLDNTEHEITLIRISEGADLLKVAAVELNGENCDILSPAPVSERRMEFFGDSITCGYGDMTPSGGSGYRTYEEDVTRSYAWMTAEEFRADRRIEAIAGQGIVKNCAGAEGYRISEFYAHTLRCGKEPHDFTAWVPQVVVINAGTNDNGGKVSEEEFASGAKTFLENLRSVYPKAQIFWLYGMMGLRYDAVLSGVIGALGGSDAGFHYVSVAPAGKGETGSGSHPNEIGQRRGADALIAEVRRVMDW